MTLQKVYPDTYISRESPTDWYVECDEPNCKSVLDCPNRTFSQVIALLKERGWKAHKATSGWLHRCPDCQGLS
jgi:hypothetical protein